MTLGEQNICNHGLYWSNDCKVRSQWYLVPNFGVLIGQANMPEASLVYQPQLIGLEITTEKGMVGNLWENKVSKILLSLCTYWYKVLGCYHFLQTSIAALQLHLPTNIYTPTFIAWYQFYNFYVQNHYVINWHRVCVPISPLLRNISCFWWLGLWGLIHLYLLVQIPQLISLQPTIES